MGIQRLVVQPGRRLLVAQPQHAVRLAGAHLLHQPDVRPVPLVVLQSADGIDQVGLLAVHILAEEPSPLGHRLQQQLAQQLCHRLQQLLAMGREGVVDESGRKAHALALALLAHGIVDIGAIQRVQRSGQALHIRVPDGAPPHNGGQQRVGRCRLPAQRRDEIQRQTARLEMLCGQIRQEHVLHDLPAVLKHSPTSWCIQISIYRIVYTITPQKKRGRIKAAFYFRQHRIMGQKQLCGAAFTIVPLLWYACRRKRRHTAHQRKHTGR